MRITYDPEADALHIRLREVDPNDSVDVEEGVTADLDEGGHVVGIEILDARQRLGDGALATISLERLPFSGYVA
jgi:uncharacterized protein YuzE